MRTGEAASSWKAGADDNSTTPVLVVAYGIAVGAMLCAARLNHLPLGHMPLWFGWAGIVLGIFGLVFRWYSTAVLGAYYTRTLQVQSGQTIVRAGPYRIVRHPGYFGSILMWTGVAASTTNWIVTLFTFVVMLAAYSYRIANEENMLMASNAEYAEYRAHTWRLFPFVY